MGNQGLKEMLKVRAELVLILYAYAKVFAVPLLEVARWVHLYLIFINQILEIPKFNERKIPTYIDTFIR